MNKLDIILLLPLLYGAFKGFQKGFILEVISILAFILALIGGFKLLHWGMALLDQHFDISGDLLPYVAFMVIFIGIIILVNLLGNMIKKVVDMTLLGPVDKLAGALLSVVKWAFGISVLLWLTASFGITFPEDWTADSILYTKMLNFSVYLVEKLSFIVPFAQDLFETIKELLQGDPTS